MTDMTRTKICGIDSIDNARAAHAAGADAIGLNFVPGSARCLPVARAAEIAAAMAGKLQLIGLFVDQPASAVRNVLAVCPLDALQFHGTESADFCAQFGLPYIKGLRAGAHNARWIRTTFPDALGWLLDTAHGGALGGTGERFDTALWPLKEPADQRDGEHWILAGGLDPDNVAAAICELRPAMVDVSSGVEGAQRGRKEPQKIAAFVAAVRSADAQLAAGGVASKAAITATGNLDGRR